ncbi:MAG: glycosyltransferase [Agathobacter sp.]|nr:glycosyltransferase [Agathobacter sp.]
MIRVLQVIHSMNLGGAENFIMNIYRVIDRDSIQFDFLVNTTGVFDDEIIRMGGKIWRMHYVNEVGPFQYHKELKKFFAEHPEYKVVHSHLDMVSGIVVECAKKAGVATCITHSHNTNISGNIFVKFLKKHYQRKIPRYADVYLACSKQAGELLYPKNSAVVINNSIDVDRFRFRQEYRDEIRNKYHISETQFVIGHVGRFSRVKNHRFLVELFEKFSKKHSEAVLMVCGDGEEKEYIKQLVRERNLSEKVIFVNASTEVYKMYSAMDVFVFPSVYEGISLSMLEAQANGLSIVASDSIDVSCNLTGHVVFLNLKQDEGAWIQSIEEAGVQERYNGTEILRTAGYDVRENAKKLLQYYQI